MSSFTKTSYTPITEALQLKHTKLLTFMPPVQHLIPRRSLPFLKRLCYLGACFCFIAILLLSPWRVTSADCSLDDSVMTSWIALGDTDDGTRWLHTFRNTLSKGMETASIQSFHFDKAWRQGKSEWSLLIHSGLICGHVSYHFTGPVLFETLSVVDMRKCVDVSSDHLLTFHIWSLGNDANRCIMSAQYTFWTPVDFIRLSMPARSMKLYISCQENNKWATLSDREWIIQAAVVWGSRPRSKHDDRSYSQ